jgi:hypothetical protein
MARTEIRLGQLLRLYVDGIPLDLASRLLPRATWFSFGLLTHIHLHARAQRKYADKEIDLSQSNPGKMSRQQMQGLIESLEGTVRKLTWKPSGTEWADYYASTNYTDAAFEHKKGLVSEWTARVAPTSVWDLGANTGVFSRLASAMEIPTVAFDVDPAAVDLDYLELKQNRERNLLPLLLDLTNPSPALGWHNRERESLFERGPADMVYALGLLHHLAISNNVPLPQLAEFFYDLGRSMVVEFIPKSDSQVKRLLASRLDIFASYTQSDFEDAFRRRFAILDSAPLPESERTLYLLQRIA